MEPVKLKGMNAVYGKEQNEYFDLPSYRNEKGDVTTVWKLTFKEKIKILFGSDIILRIKTFNKPLQPVSMFLDKEK